MELGLLTSKELDRYLSIRTYLTERMGNTISLIVETIKMS
jgi:hypothetical protein